MHVSRTRDPVAPGSSQSRFSRPEQQHVTRSPTLLPGGIEAYLFKSRRHHAAEARQKQAAQALAQIADTTLDAYTRVALAVDILNNRDAFAAIREWAVHHVPQRPGARHAATQAIWAERKRLRTTQRQAKA
jgi:hypothetical protein